MAVIEYAYVQETYVSCCFRYHVYSTRGSFLPRPGAVSVLIMCELYDVVLS